MSDVIGVYDSGSGGLSVLKHLQQQFPHQDFIYLADTCHLPYGNKTSEQIYHYSRSICHWFKQQNVKLIVSACHTSSLIAVDSIARHIQTPIIGMARPLLRYLNHYHSKERVLMMATPTSVKSGCYPRMMESLNSRWLIDMMPCYDLVDIIESGNKDQIRNYLRRLFQNIDQSNIDVVVLGCTHYALIQLDIETYLGAGVICIDPATFIADAVRPYVTMNTETSLGSCRYVCTSSGGLNLGSFAFDYVAIDWGDELELATKIS